MYQLTLAAHSGLRYVVFLLLVLALIQSITGWLGQKSYTNGHRKLNLFTMVSAHVQFLLGLILYFVSPFVKYNDMATAMKDATLRYWTVEHAAMMIFALVLITVGHARSKKAQEGFSKHRAVAVFYGLATIIIIAAIIQSGRGLFGMSV